MGTAKTSIGPRTTINSLQKRSGMAILMGNCREKLYNQSELEAPEELKKWVDSLSMAEKRFVKLLGKARAGSSNSQQLELFDWLNRAAAGDHLPDAAKFLSNFATVSNRLKDLIMDALRLLHKEDGIDALLRTTLDEIAILIKKKLFVSAGKQVKRVKRLALQTARYGLALQAMEQEQLLLQRMDVGEGVAALKQLREAEAQVRGSYAALRDLEFRHDALRMQTRQLTFPRDAATLQAVADLCDAPSIPSFLEKGGYVEQLLAANILGIRDIFEHRSSGAVDRYAHLLKEWQAHPEWQLDQSARLLFACNCFLIAGYYGNEGAGTLQAHHALLPDFSAMSPEIALQSRSMLYQNEFTLALNTAHFDRVNALLPEIDAWLQQEAASLSEARILPFLHNFAIAEFLMERHAAASGWLRRILHLPHARIRKDIRDFARVLQLVLQFELDRGELNVSLARSAKRYFGKAMAAHRFELLVIEGLERVDAQAGSRESMAAMDQLRKNLEGLGNGMVDVVPPLGWMELRLWAAAKASGRPLQEVFAEAVRENLKGLT
jgi:hypothetical protein